MNPRKKKQKNPPFLSLPNEIILACLARISRTYNPKLALVCKTFRSLIVSYDLAVARYHLNTQETVFELCLQCLNSSRRYLFTLWTKPGRPEKYKRSTRNTRLIQIPSSCNSYKPLYTVSVGSEQYGLSQSKTPSSSMWIVDKKSYSWQKATIPNMSVAREKPLAVVLNGKIYVMGGCAADESVNYGEVFDPKTQTWEPLPDPGAELRFSSIRKLEVLQGKLYVRSNKNDFVYDPKEGKWDVAVKSLVQCLIDDVRYRCDEQNCLWWYDTNHEKWRVVEGLATLIRKRGCGMIEIANYGGKLLILWVKFVNDHDPCSYKDIWCALIALERSNGIDEVWGNIKWAEIVLTVPRSYVFLHSLLSKRDQISSSFR